MSVRAIPPLPEPHALLSSFGARAPGLFLDFDGTLVDLAPAPDAIAVSPMLPPLLRELLDRLEGALAVVSGRQVVELDRYLGYGFPAAGVHGLERRSRADGDILRIEGVGLEPVIDQLSHWAAGDERLRIERKPGAVALHYRAAPEREAQCREAVRALTGDHPDLHVLHGKMVFEIKPKAIDKGRAIADFCASPPFANRLPVFLGDDVTDEDGFRVVDALEGVSVKVGEGTTAAAYRLADVAAVHHWLARLLDHLHTG